MSVFGVPSPWILNNVASNKVRRLSEAAKVYINDHGTGACVDFSYNWFNGVKRMLAGNFFNAQFRECIAYYDATQPVIVEAKLHIAEFIEMKIPGIGVLTLVKVFLPQNQQMRNELISESTWIR